MNSLFFLSICRIFDNILHVRRGRCITSLTRLPLHIFSGMEISSASEVKANNSHHLYAHIVAVAVISSDHANVPTSSIERGMSICCMVLSI